MAPCRRRGARSCVDTLGARTCFWLWELRRLGRDKTRAHGAHPGPEACPPRWAAPSSCAAGRFREEGGRTQAGAEPLAEPAVRGAQEKGKGGVTAVGGPLSAADLPNKEPPGEPSTGL